VAVGVGIASMAVAIAIGAVGNVVGSAIAGVDTVWDDGPLTLALIVLGNVMGMLTGFVLGVLVRNSAGAIVGYFVYAFVVPTLTSLLAQSQEWFRHLQPWVDPNFSQSALYDGPLSATEWAHLAVTTTVWLVVPLAIGLRLLMRSEVK
jgi:ABC-2 type transport system permease protein